MPFDEPEANDPMEMVGMVMPGEPGQLEAMAECIVEEYVRLGWDARRLMTLFVNPMFMATYRIYRQKGEAYVRELIDRTCAKWTFTTTPATLLPSAAFVEEWNESQPGADRRNELAQSPRDCRVSDVNDCRAGAPVQNRRVLKRE